MLCYILVYKCKNSEVFGLNLYRDHQKILPTCVLCYSVTQCFSTKWGHFQGGGGQLIHRQLIHKYIWYLCFLFNLPV